MKEAVYRNNNIVIFNFSKMYFSDYQEVINSPYFSDFVYSYVTNLQDEHPEYYEYVVGASDKRLAVVEIVRFARLLLVFELHEIDHPLVNNLSLVDAVVEDIYNYWRKLQRFSLMYAGSGDDIQTSNFIESDSKFNSLIIGMYRKIQEKIRGRKNNVYRQLQAGTNASIVLRDYRVMLPDGYEKIRKVPFIDSLMLRTPLILFPKSNKREGTFVEIYKNPLDSFEFSSNEWMVYPAKVGTLLTFVYFHRDFLPGIVALSNLFELASDADCVSRKPDLVLLFGNQDKREACEFYEDLENNMVVGSVSYGPKIDYFGYLKKMILTIHNVKMIRDGFLPIHGAMINVTFKSGLKKGVVLIGDSGAGKSESIEAMQNLASDRIRKIDVIYDDMGSMYIKDNVVYSMGTEIGAFIRLDDLEKGSAYRDMDRSIFFNPHLHNARVVLPVNTYGMISMGHKVDMVLYANNYTNELGIKRFNDYREAKDTFIEGKRMAMGTTDEKGITKTYFANPFGPIQKQEVCDVIFEEVFTKLFTNDIFVGEIYTHLGLSESKDKLTDGAKCLLELMEK